MVVTSRLKDRTMNCLFNSSTALEGIAWGSTATVFDSANTGLTDELYRDSVNNVDTSGPYNGVNFEGYADTTEMVNGTTLKETGLFGNDTALVANAMILDNMPWNDKDSSFEITSQFRIEYVRRDI